MFPTGYRPAALLLALALLWLAPTAQAQRTYAVVVGVADYQYSEQLNALKDLHFADDDARAVHRFLGDANGYVALLTDQQATKANILETAKRVFGMATANDKLLFFFSGHGLPGGFIPYDFSGENFLLHSEIKAVFKQSRARLRVCIADACHAGSIRQKAGGQPQAAAPDAASADVVVVMSSRGGEVSQEHPQLRQGVFTYFLLKALQGSADTNADRRVSVSELFGYLSGQVAGFTQQKQHPVIFGRFDKNMILVNY